MQQRLLHPVNSPVTAQRVSKHHEIDNRHTKKVNLSHIRVLPQSQQSCHGQLQKSIFR